MKRTNVSGSSVRIGPVERQFARRLDAMPGVTRLFPPMADRSAW